LESEFFFKQRVQRLITGNTRQEQEERRW